MCGPARATITNNRLVNWSGVGILATGISGATIECNRIDSGPFANSVAGCLQTKAVAASGISLGSVTNSVVRGNVVNLDPSGEARRPYAPPVSF